MNTAFFTITDTQRSINEKINEIPSANISEPSFNDERDILIKKTLQSMLSNAQQWDNTTQFNIDAIGDRLTYEMNLEYSDKNQNLLFATLFRFHMEAYAFDSSINSDLTLKVKDFALYRQDEFDERSSTQLSYAIKEMPVSMMRKLFSSENAKSCRELIKKQGEFEETRKEWDKTLSSNIDKSQELNESLVMQLNKFNFVGLFKGFSELGEKKKKEQKWAQSILFIIGALIPAPLIFELVYISNNPIKENEWQNMLSIIPIISLTLILIYFFRVALQNVNSIRAQLVQIDLRMSLCQFIQNYAEYAKNIRGESPDLLVKFEEVIFSNIMPSEEKIPSTFDGIEQLSTLFAAIKK